VDQIPCHPEGRVPHFWPGLPEVGIFEEFEADLVANEKRNFNYPQVKP
jgi:hypothetical protein